MANTTIEKWGVFELSLTGNTNGNPFIDYEIHGTFTCENESVTVSGFYDGDGIYKIRFMPSYEGTYHYEISGTFSGSTATGTFQATAPTGSNHGPVQVSHTFHLAYADHTPHFSVGTTCYTFDLQDPSIVEQTFAELEKGYFNKLRFCIMPKHYDFCLHDPCAFPYEGTPMDASRLTRENFMEYTGKTEGNLPHCWGNLTAEELTRRSWEAAIRGGYCGHSETYLSKDNLIWWCHGNTLKGESAKRFGFLMDFLKDVPGCGLKEGRLRDNIHFQWDDNLAVPQDDQYAGTWYFYYFSLWRPSFRQIYIDDTTWYDAEIIDTWNMEITPAGRHKGKYELELPGRQYMGIRLKKSADQGDRG